MCRVSSSCSTSMSSGFSRRPTSQPGRPTSQAALLQNRGDFLQGRAHFEARLPKASPLAFGRRDRPCAAQIGMDLLCSKSSGGRLVVASVDKHPLLKTPVAQLNCSETRQADRGEGECHMSRAILPGDRIRALRAEKVEGFRGCATIKKGYLVDEDPVTTMRNSAMLRELADAGDFAEPKEINLSVSRDVSNLLQPAPHANVLMMMRPQSSGASSRISEMNSPCVDYTRPNTSPSILAEGKPRSPAMESSALPARQQSTSTTSRGRRCRRSNVRSRCSLVAVERSLLTF